MDVCSVVTNQGNTNLISNLLLEPYQLKLLTRYKAEASGSKKQARELTLHGAKAELSKNLKSKAGDQIQRSVDEFLAKLVGESGEIEIDAELKP